MDKEEKEVLRRLIMRAIESADGYYRLSVRLEAADAAIKVLDGEKIDTVTPEDLWKDFLDSAKEGTTDDS
jgi:hypothetical protein